MAGFCTRIRVATGTTRRPGASKPCAISWVPTIALSAVVGTSVFASLNASPAAATAIAVGIVGITATVLAALQTFLDYAGRAERHRAAAVKNKSVIRELEQALTGSLDRRDPRDEWFGELRARLDSLEDTTPVVAQGIWERVEKTYPRVDFVGTAKELTRNRKLAPDEGSEGGKEDPLQKTIRDDNR